MVYTAWKQRLYAFLLRRVLGPYLSSCSLQKLHESIEVSLQEGRFALKDVDLNASYLTEILPKRGDAHVSVVSVHRARIRKLQIHLTLEETTHSDDDDDDEATSSPDGSTKAPSSSVAWRAMQLGSEGGAVKLLAHVEIEGFDIEVEPGNHEFTTPPPARSEPEEATSTAAGMIASYVDAALSSLRLSLQMKDLRVKLCTAREKLVAGGQWIELHLASARYHDVDDRVSSSDRQVSNYRTVMHKAVDFAGISFRTGSAELEQPKGSSSQQEKPPAKTSVVAMTEGSGQVSLRVIEYLKATLPTTTEESPTQQPVTELAQIQHDLEVKLNQRLNFSVDHESLQSLVEVASSFLETNGSLSVSDTSSVGEALPSVNEAMNESEHGDEDRGDDDADWNTMTGIMKQYTEARQLAERNEVRGGILIPTSAFEDGVSDGDSISFDAFFDANDHSFSLYKSRLEHSIMPSDATDDEKSDFVHTKVRFHLQQCGVKVAFPNADDGPFSQDEARRKRMADEYILLTLGDISVTSSLSQKVSDVSFDVVHLEVEDSMYDRTSLASRRGFPPPLEIGNVLSFSTGLESGAALVTEAPCISMHVLVQHGSSSSCSIDLMLEPLELFVRGATLSNTMNLVSQLKSNQASSAGECGDSDQTRSWRFSASCPSVSVVLPLGCETLDHVHDKEQRFSVFDRCGYVLPNAPLSRRSSIGLTLDAFSISHGAVASNEGDADLGTSVCNNTAPATVSCHRMIMFVTAPRLKSGQSVMYRADIVASSGHAPITLSRRLITPENEKSTGRLSFPTVPPLSSFKARQEDDDSSDEGMFSEDVVSAKISAVRASDPQDVLIGVAEQCSTIVDLYLPDLSGDLTRDEAASLLNLVLAELSRVAKGSSGRQSSCETSSEVERDGHKSDAIGFSISVDQVSLTAHQFLDGDTNVSRWYSHKLMAEGFKAYAAISQSCLRTCRVLAHELNLFEVQDLVNNSNVDTTGGILSLRDRCDNVRKRTMQRGMSIATPIFYRSQLFVPLSPESPSFLLDVFTSDDVASGECNVHLTMYNMTHRCDVDSQWHQRLQKLFCERNSPHGESETAPKCAPESPRSPDEASKLTKLFVSLADCNVDYTTPEKFSTHSRCIVRLSDLRFSSNLVSPRGPSQAFRISLGDLTILLCNSQYAHNFENARLSRASTVLREEDLITTGRNSTPDGVLHDMNLITMLSLDSVDLMMALQDLASSPIEPRTTIDLTLGSLNLYGCKDSFACLTSTIGELQAFLTAVDEEGMNALREKDSKEPCQAMFGSETTTGGRTEAQRAGILPLVASTEDADERRFIVGDDFSLGGEDWATIEHEWSASGTIPPDEEQSARWYASAETDETGVDSTIGVPSRVGGLDQSFGSASTDGPTLKLNIIPNHIPLTSVRDPLSQKDMNTERYAGTASPPPVQARVIIRDFRKFRCRFFDGYDWPKSKKRLPNRNGHFVINSMAPERKASEKAELHEQVAARIDDSQVNEELEKKAKLLGELVDDGTEDEEGPFRDVPLPEERGEMLEDLAEQRRLARRINKFFQFSFSGMALRLDAFAESDDHFLSYITDVKVADLFLAETISSAKPVKLLGEWFNEKEHPRDSNDGLIMLKMVTWHPRIRVTEENEIANDESHVVLEMLPLRCKVDQRAVRFVMAFFSSEEDKQAGHDWASGLKEIPPPLFQSFKIKSCKLKVNYTPEKVDVAALRQGSYVELINISPLVDMVIKLQPVDLHDHIGFGANVKELLSRWIEDICATQMHKFLANAKPFQPFSSVSGHAADLFVLPWEAYKTGNPVGRAVRTGAASFAGAFAYETLNTGARVTGYAAQVLSSASSPSRQTAQVASPLPSRPNDTPHGVGETANHALESLARGLETANYKIVIVPYREYRKSGTTGAVKSVLRGIPVAIAAPMGAATEALSYTLLGARNQVRPDIRKEEEATERGLKHDL